MSATPLRLLPPKSPLETRADLLSRLAEMLDLFAGLAREQASLDVEAAAAPPPTEDPLLTVSEIAKELGLGISTARAKCARGEIRAMHDGAGYRARLSALRAYERRRTKG